MNARNTRRLTFFGVALVAMGLLLWARLILVTGRPRTAIADPEAKERAAAPKKAAEPKGQNPAPAKNSPPQSP